MTFFNPIPSDMELPQLFTNPFDYTPSKVVKWVVGELIRYIEYKTEWAEELSRGKMFGVLIVRKPDGVVGYLFAFSGNLGGKTIQDFFVPPIFDLQSPISFFRAKEDKISQINGNICGLSQCNTYIKAKSELKECKDKAIADITEYKSFMRLSKSRREALRCSSPSSEALHQLVAESQFQKAELKRKTAKWEREIEQRDRRYTYLTDRINGLKATRQRLSQELQREIFDSYILRNHLGENRSLTDIFAERRSTPPPAGAGECAAPKLLHYAYSNDLTPIAMGEFWWGESPIGEVRHHREFYPACQSKCVPILGYMLDGLTLEVNDADYSAKRDLRVIYQDEWLAVVDKPSGLLSVKGRVDSPSVEANLSVLFPQSTDAKVVHRLDMDTSGLMLIALDSATYRDLQRQFAQRLLSKEYLAILDGVVVDDWGDITLPLSSDYEQRPRQRVDYKSGKVSHTHYEVLSREGNKTRVRLIPHTGRTHQLRVHCAHTDGIGIPIVGDRLYGHPNKRLMLQALKITFMHPKNNKELTFELAPEF